jgi:DMSO/TMAO reductase YedYZ molybdopterin-dependent catalytic subunit
MNSTKKVARRDLLRAGAAALPLAYAREAWALGAGGARAGGDGLSGGLITREQEPQNLEFPFATLDRFITPNHLFYIRNHFKQPALDAGVWRLRVEGAVERPFELTYEDLVKLPSRKRTAMLECAGNGRVLLSPKVPGAQWELGAVSNAEWTGIPLSALLERAGVKPGAVEVVLEGADRGAVNDEPKSPGEIPFARSLPLEKAREDVLLAHRMNGEPLPAAHGFPLRAIVPGWYGMASVKWLTRIMVVDRPFEGFFQSLQYTYWERVGGLPSMRPVTQMQVKAEISRPTAREVVPRGRTYRVHGAAWTGIGEVVKVEVSTDGGRSWDTARLLGDSVGGAWRLWEYGWKTPSESGNRRLMARATDSAGRVQPMERDSDHRTYMISHVVPIEVEIR